MSRLKGYRVMCGLTQEDIAKSIGISRLSYLHKENGNKRFHSNEELAIVKLLKEKLPSIEREDVFPII